MKDKEKELNKLVTDVILKAGVEEGYKHSPFWNYLIDHKDKPTRLSRSEIDKEIIACVKDLDIFYEVLEGELFKVRLDDVIDNIISLIETGEEGKAYSKYKKHKYTITIDNKDMTDELKKSMKTCGFKQEEEE